MTLVLDLTEEQKAHRKTGIGGSHAPRLMAGDWQEVWLELTGRVQPKRVMSEWNYALRMVTETLQMDWLEYKTAARVIHRSASLRSSVYPYIRATLDGVIEGSNEPVNAKHVSGWTKEARAWTMDKYVWQIIHETVVLMPPTMRGWISLIVGEKEPELFPIEVDPVSLDKLVEVETDFWNNYVVPGIPPDPEHPSVAHSIAWETMRTVSMATSNTWSEWATEWLETRAAAKRHKDAEVEIKALVEKDVREAYGHGIVCTRDRVGRLGIRERSDV
jgi:predicted phage-related endonuclease